ncbi:MAG: Omp28-related outer membrane protein, partial [Bacteroidia bacterium]
VSNVSQVEIDNLKLYKDDGTTLMFDSSVGFTDAAFTQIAANVGSSNAGSTVTTVDNSNLINPFTTIGGSTASTTAGSQVRFQKVTLFSPLTLTVKAIKDANPGRVVSIGLHSGPEIFTHPKSDYSKYDFRTEDGDRIAALLGATGSLPEGCVDRIYVENEKSIVVNRLLWEGITNARLAKENPVNITVTTQKLTADTAIVLVRILYNKIVTGENHFLNVYVTEDGIIDYQYDIRVGDIKDYKHEHVFRKNLTNSLGDSLVAGSNNVGYVEGRVFQRRFVIPVKKDTPGEEFKTGWNHEKLSIVAFVSKRNENDFEVIHVVEEHL